MFFLKKSFLVCGFLIVPLLVSACVSSLGGGKAAPREGTFVERAIVDGFPNNMPLYEGSKVVESYGETENFGASFISEDGLAKVFEFYQNALPALGWQTNVKQNSETNFTFEIKSDAYFGTVIVNTAADFKSTAITIAVSAR